MSKHGALVVVGSGPGIGAHVAAHFAVNGFDPIVLMSRNLERLNNDAMLVRMVAPGAVVMTASIDLGTISKIENALKEVERRLEQVDIGCVFFNAVKPSMNRILEWSSRDLRLDLHLSVVSLYAIIRWAMPHFLDRSGSSAYTPALLVACADHVDSGSPDWFSLTACRAAQRDIMASCTKEYGPKGILCDQVLVQTTISEGRMMCNAPLVAQDVWKTYSRLATAPN